MDMMILISAEEEEELVVVVVEDKRWTSDRNSEVEPRAPGRFIRPNMYEPRSHNRETIQPAMK